MLMAALRSDSQTADVDGVRAIQSIDSVQVVVVSSYPRSDWWQLRKTIDADKLEDSSTKGKRKEKEPREKQV